MKEHCQNTGLSPMILEDVLRKMAVEQLQALMRQFLIFFEKLVPDSYCLLCPQLFLFIVSISLRIQFSFYVRCHSQKQEAKVLILEFSCIFH